MLQKSIPPDHHVSCELCYFIEPCYCWTGGPRSSGWEDQYLTVCCS